MSYKLYYWPLPFRGNFIRLMLADAGAEFSEAPQTELEEIYAQDAAVQPFPVMAPPFLHDGEADIFLSQMPAIASYLAARLNYDPPEKELSMKALKLILDCNDILDEITNHGGSRMWTKNAWKEFRENRFATWLSIFEETGRRSGLEPERGWILGTKDPSQADIAVCALLETISYCLPELATDIEKGAPHVSQLSKRVSKRPRIAGFLAAQRQKTGRQYCGGQIEESIRSMLSQ